MEPKNVQSTWEDKTKDYVASSTNVHKSTCPLLEKEAGL